MVIEKMFSFPQKKDFFQIFFLVRVDSHFFPWAKPNVNSLHGLNPNLLFEIVSKHFHFENETKICFEF